MTFSLGNINNAPDILKYTLHFFSPIENINNTGVCKKWNELATEIAKKQIVESTLYTIEARASNFLKMVPNPLSFYCPTFEKFEKISKDYNEYSIKELFNLANKVTVKQNTCMAGFIRIDPESPNIPPESRDLLASRTFVALHARRPHYHARTKQGYFDFQWGGQLFFPIELFNLTVSDISHTVTGNKNSGIFCFPYDGRVFEITLEEGQEETRNKRFKVQEMNRDVGLTKTLDSTLTHQDFYIPKLNAPTPKMTGKKLRIL